MSEEQFKIWKQVEAKGLEKLEKVEKALTSTEKEGFEEAHKDYCDFIEKLAETTGLTTGELDRHLQRYKAIGNGWTAEMIIHILSYMNIPKDEQLVVLSLYDGIATGRYCLEKLGYKNIKYYAYEIDENPVKCAMDNYPDIIQCGDAFKVREENWKLET